MASPCEVLMDFEDEAVARRVLEAVSACAWRIERKFSRYRGDNIVARINLSSGVAVEVDDETANLLDFAALAHQLSDGMFDITSGVLRRAWTFDGGDRTPSADAIEALLPLVGWSKATWRRPFFTLPKGMQIDFGGIGKEYAVDQAVMLARGVVDKPVLVNFGGDLAVCGPRAGGGAWRVGIEGLDASTAHPAKLIDLSAGALATSGDTHRFLRSNGQRLSHILDPRDGHPVRGAPRSVTVAAAACVQAGLFTTLAMLRGAGAEEFLAAEGVRYWVQR